MSYIIGIDTGGTYTDAVIFDADSRVVLAEGKARTTKDDLSRGISAALDLLPRDIVSKASLAALSTTLATNACVEGRGGRAKLILIGTTPEVLDWIGADDAYGLNRDDVLCINARGSFDGTVLAEVDWDNVLAEHADFFAGVQAIAAAEVFALRNGGAVERRAEEALAQLGVPVVTAYSLSDGPNIMERGATALLNARLLFVASDFIAAVQRSLAERGIDVPVMIVRSDGGLMSAAMSGSRPVETIMSGPAASVLGGRELAGGENCLIVDMGGTTTDVSVVENGIPAFTDGIAIGKWRTQVKGVRIDTFGLGGDSRLTTADGRLAISEKRVEPISAAAVRFPRIKDTLRSLLCRDRFGTLPYHEGFFLLKDPDDRSLYDYTELTFIDALKREGCIMIGGEGVEPWKLRCARLEDEGVVMRIGLTPTDIMHVKGDFVSGDREAAVLAAEYFSRRLGYPAGDEGIAAFCADVYEEVERKLYCGLIRAMADRFCDGASGENMMRAADESFRTRSDRDRFFRTQFTTRATLVGVGAPTHIFLPEVAAALGTTCVVPDHAAVANAVGAAVADVAAEVKVSVSPVYTAFGVDGYIVHSPGGAFIYGTLDESIAAADKAAREAAAAEARRRGAAGELDVSSDVKNSSGRDRDGATVELGVLITARAAVKKR